MSRPWFSDPPPELLCLSILWSSPPLSQGWTCFSQTFRTTPPQLTQRYFLGKLRPKSYFCPATACHRLSQELTFNLNLSRWASGNVKRSVSQVVTPALALIFTQLGCQHLSSHISLADSFGFLFSPFLHHTPFTVLCSPSLAPTPEKLCLGAGALSHWLERASTGQRAFRTEATRPSDSQHTHSPPRRHCPDSSQAVTPSSVWSCSFQSDLACHSDYAFWLIFYEA